MPFKSFYLAFLLSGLIAFNAHSAFPDTVASVKASVVGVGVYAPLGAISHQLNGTGFVIGDGHYVVTNEHVINSDVQETAKYSRVVYLNTDKGNKIIPVEEVFTSPKYDIAILRLKTALTPARLAPATKIVPDGTDIGLTGFPIGAVLGLFPATHKGIVAAMTPNVTAAKHTSQLTDRQLSALSSPFMVYQLDIVAYPGNSGSPVYDAGTGEIFAVINKVFVKDTRESAIAKPSGITYAIPIEHVYALAAKHNIALE